MTPEKKNIRRQNVRWCICLPLSFCLRDSADQALHLRHPLKSSPEFLGKTVSQKKRFRIPRRKLFAYIVAQISKKINTFFSTNFVFLLDVFCDKCTKNKIRPVFEADFNIIWRYADDGAPLPFLPCVLHVPRSCPQAVCRPP